jgi:hypothetical protein
MNFLILALKVTRSEHACCSVKNNQNRTKKGEFSNNKRFYFKKQ